MPNKFLSKYFEMDFFSVLVFISSVLFIVDSFIGIALNLYSVELSTALISLIFSILLVVLAPQIGLKEKYRYFMGITILIINNLLLRRFLLFGTILGFNFYLTTIPGLILYFVGGLTVIFLAFNITMFENKKVSQIVVSLLIGTIIFSIEALISFLFNGLGPIQFLGLFTLLIVLLGILFISVDLELFGGLLILIMVIINSLVMPDEINGFAAGDSVLLWISLFVVISSILEDYYEERKIPFAMPYTIEEGIGWVIRFKRGPSRRNSGNIDYIPSGYILNKGSPKYILGFIGDIMETRDNDLKIGEDVKDFFKNCNYLFGNFEATITTEKRIFMDQRHSPQIMDALESLFPPSKTYLSMANNHTGDFGIKCFSDSVKALRDRGFNVFGLKNQPFADLENEIRIIGCSAWSNRPCDYLARLDDAPQYLKKESFCILYPHWGYEIELYPRISIIKQGKDLLDDFDAIIGHHSHCPQPIRYELKGEQKKLIAYSLGDFSFGIPLKNFRFFQYGLILKVELGKSKDNEWQFGKIEWRFVKTSGFADKNFKINIVEDFPLLNQDKINKSD